MRENEWLTTFSGNLRDIMEEVGISQRELARDAGLSESMISDYVNGKCMPSVKSLVNLIHSIPEANPIDLIYFDDRID